MKTDSSKRVKFITSITMLYNFVWAVCKILFGIYKSTFLYCLSGGYTILIAFTKRIFITNHNRSDTINKETKAIVMGVLILIAGIVFGVYFGTFYILPKNTHFPKIWAITLALCSFVELGVAIFNLVRVKRKHDILLTSLRCCNIVSAFFAIVITQVALLSISSTLNVSLWNANSGILAGVLAVFVGIVVIVKACKQDKIKKSDQNERALGDIIDVLVENEQEVVVQETMQEAIKTLEANEEIIEANNREERNKKDAS